jgi:DNA polymerase III delta prime subunit
MLRQYSKILTMITIAALLFLGEFAIELLAPDVGKFVEQTPQLKRLLWGLLVFCLGAYIIRFLREHNALASLAEGRADAVLATEADQVNRRFLLRQVRHNLVEGILHKSLWNEVRLILNLERRPNAVVRYCDLELRRAGQPDTYIQPGTPILEVYQHEQEELLLLGDPGSGKTTLLLEIAEALLQEAEKNQTYPIPVVFNLSTWRKKHTRLDIWLVEQLNREYKIPEETGKRWVYGGQMLLLLDGLDEVAADRRASCVEAINVYRLKHQKVLRPMVVCCRVREYNELPDLQLGGAVVIQPLTRAQVDDYLKDGGKVLAGLRAVLKDEPLLYRELFATPLMLHVAVITYEGQSAAELRRSVNPEERRRRLWDAYIERMFERKQEVEPKYEKAQALDWLGWLGWYLTRKDLQKYLIEAMQPNDLPRYWQTFLVRWLLSILFVPAFLLGPLIVGYSDRTINVYTGMTAVSVLWVMICHSKDIELQPIRRFTTRHLRQQWKSILIKIAKGATGGAGLGAVMAVVFVAIDVARGEVKGEAWEGVMFLAAIFAVFFGMLGGMMVAIDTAESSLFFDESILENTIRPNEGIHHSLRTAALGSAYVVAFGAAGGVAIGMMAVGVDVRVFFAAYIGASFAVIIAVIVALILGGRSAFQHYLLRLLLWRSGQFPLDITMFLDWTTQRVLLQRAGGGWWFVHRTLQERFAERYDEKYTDERRFSPPE